MNQPIERPASRLGAWVSLACLTLAVAGAGTLFAASAADYQKRLAALNGDLAAEHYALGLWAQEQKLSAEAREQFEHTIHLDPGNKEALAKIAETAPTKKPCNPKCEFTMISGEKIKADLMMPILRIETASGPVSIPTGEIDIIELGAPPAKDKLITDAFTGQAAVKVDVFIAQSKVGAINVKRGDVKLIRLFRACPECDGKGKMACKRCNGSGRLSADKTVCPECNGKAKVRCKTCNGTAKIKCPLCGGSGRIQGMWGRFGNAPCPRCHGGGTLECPDCDAGGKTCPVCNGRSSTGKPGACPACNGLKIVDCAACGGTGAKPAPKTEDEMKAEAEKDAPKPAPIPTPPPD